MTYIIYNLSFWGERNGEMFVEVSYLSDVCEGCLSAFQMKNHQATDLLCSDHGLPMAQRLGIPWRSLETTQQGDNEWYQTVKWNGLRRGLDQCSNVVRWSYGWDFCSDLFGFELCKTPLLIAAGLLSPVCSKPLGVGYPSGFVVSKLLILLEPQNWDHEWSWSILVDSSKTTSTS